MNKKVRRIGLYALTIVVMIVLIPVVTNDYLLAVIYFAVTMALFVLGAEEHDGIAWLLGLAGITTSEYFFISTGVETFNRISLFGVMPIWLPFLWAYAFVVIKRSLHLLQN